MIARLFEWVTSSPPATMITALGVLVTALRIQSNREHRKTLAEIRGVGQQVNGGLLARIDRIEKALGIGGEDSNQ